MSSTMRRAHSDVRLARRVGAVTALGALAVLLVAGAVLNGWLGAAELPHASSAASRRASQDCSARYAALLDLAELARQDRASSELVARGLSDRSGALSGCR